MKHCPFCGAQLEESARFCLYCMTSLDEKVTVGATAPKTKRWQGFLAAALAFSILLVTVWAIWQGIPPAPDPTVPATATTATGTTTAETVAATTSMATTSTETTVSTTATTTTTTTAQVVPFSTGSSAATATTTVKPTTTTTNPTTTTTKRATTTTKLTTSTTKQTITTTTRITTTVQTTTTKKPYTNVTGTFTAPTVPAHATVYPAKDWFETGEKVNPIPLSNHYEELKDKYVEIVDVVYYSTYNASEQTNEYFVLMTLYNSNEDCVVSWWGFTVPPFAVKVYHFNANGAFGTKEYASCILKIDGAFWDMKKEEVRIEINIMMDKVNR